MTAENLLVRILGSCETMANISVLCTDKTGTSTQNSTNVVGGSIAFIRNLFATLRTRANAPDQEQDQLREEDVTEVANGLMNFK